MLSLAYHSYVLTPESLPSGTDKIKLLTLGFRLSCLEDLKLSFMPSTNIRFDSLNYSYRICFGFKDINLAKLMIYSCHNGASYPVYDIYFCCLKKKSIILTWYGDDCSTVEISGLDIGWGQRLPLEFDEYRGLWILRKELPEGYYEYKYIVDGEWVYNRFEPVTSPNEDGHVNNCMNVFDRNSNSTSAATRKRLADADPDLTQNERLTVRQFLDTFPVED
nr:phosphoglucan phosphatase DSP4, amyloplastic-like [Ipomoea trifida]